MLPIQVITVIKYGFLGLVVTGAGFLIANTAVPMHYKIEALEDISYKAQVSVWNDSSLLDRNLKCLKESSKPFCLIPKNKRLKLLRNRHHVSRASKPQEIETLKPKQPSQVYELMVDFLSFANSLGIKPFLLQPYMLFCVLSAYQKYQILISGLNTTILQGSSSEVTFGVFEKDSIILSDENSTRKYLETGYEFKSLTKKSENSKVCFFYSRYNLTIRVIVLFERKTFLGYPGLSDSPEFHSDFFRQACSFENFTQVPLLQENGIETDFYLPSDLNRFLLQIQRSKFEDCPPSSKMLSPHPSLSLEQLHLRVSIVIQELKSALRPHMGTFWIWSETLSGWNEYCDLFEKTPEFNVAVPGETLSKINMNQSFIRNEYLQQLEDTELEHRLILDCYGLRINVFKIYENNRYVWDYEKNSTGHWIKRSFLKFELCSIEVMGLLVHKPCGKFLGR